MKQVILVLAIILMFNSGKAEVLDSEKELTRAQRRQIAWALNILAKYQIMTVDENKCVEFKPNLIERLKAEGLLKRNDSALMSVCIDGAN